MDDALTRTGASGGQREYTLPAARAFAAGVPGSGVSPSRAASRYGFGPTGRTLRVLPSTQDLHHLLGHERPTHSAAFVRIDANAKVDSAAGSPIELQLYRDGLRVTVSGSRLECAMFLRTLWA